MVNNDYIEFDLPHVTLPTGHPCKAVLRRPEDGMWEGPEAVRQCGKTDDVKPMCFNGEPWCSDNHRKKVESQRRVCGHEENVCPGLKPHQTCCSYCHEEATRVSVDGHGDSGDDVTSAR